MKLINRVLLVLTITAWTAFFIEIWNVKNYWFGVAILIGLLILTAVYIFTKPSSVKTMSEDENDDVILPNEELAKILQTAKPGLDPEAFSEATGHIEFRNWRSPDWQECYQIAEKEELDRKVDEIIENVRQRRTENAPRI